MGNLQISVLFFLMKYNNIIMIVIRNSKQVTSQLTSIDFSLEIHVWDSWYVSLQRFSKYVSLRDNCLSTTCDRCTIYVNFLRM